MQNYIFGYGSLIERESRLRTTPNAQRAFPVNIKGYVRGWWARTGVEGFSTTFLGCIALQEQTKKKYKSENVNGVLYEVNEEDLQTTDIREKGYKRELVRLEAINDYSGLLEFDANVWIYLNDFANESDLKKNIPSTHFPIVQSYVDLCINGCLEIEAMFPNARNSEFTLEFISSTQFWSKYWVNDRIYPRRPFIYCPNAYQIDQLLKDNLLDQSIFENIYFE